MRARIAASIGLAAVISLTATGCGFIAPQATQLHYDASDGTSVTVGDVKVVNALVISEDGKTGNLLASVANLGTERVSVSLQYEGSSGSTTQKVSVAGGEYKSLGTEEPFLLTDIDTEPGATLPIFVQYGNETGKVMMVPVLDGSLPEYADYTP